MTRRTPALLVLALAVLVVALAVLVLALGALAPAAASAQQTGARLESTFQMSGRVTAARNVRGEHVGEIVQRTWTFTPLCATGPCAQVRLVRGRGNGTDSLILDQTTPGHYAGAGRFFAPLECGGTVYATGEEVPFEIKLHVTATGTAPDGTTVATQIAATYLNQSRVNLTRCVIVLGHDTARYTGTDVTTS
jgi:hypothetical protein